jgi:hypothetical protein
MLDLDLHTTVHELLNAEHCRGTIHLSFCCFIPVVTQPGLKVKVAFLESKR